ncbi:MAG: A24 family peptidase C-terminal domain-containing protein [Thermoplasmatota archaeon]|nr:prepilin peptidase [Candidatus Thermoplasmatota archaeon]MBU1913690.1 prepilin peptidase [Candidatus Thermoplasmatota archaeon]
MAPAIIVLTYASVLDWRTRRVPNTYWIALSLVGLALIPIQLLVDDQDLKFLLIMVPILVILSDVYWGSEEGPLAKYMPVAKYAVAVVAIVALAYLWGTDEYFQHFLAVPIMMLLIVVMYMLDVIRGGADAKALLSLSILFPFYPALGSFPILHSDAPSAEIIFPFSFVILITAAVVVVLLPLGFLAKNLASRDFQFPLAFLGYRMESAEIARSHVWLMERIQDGRHVTSTRTRRDEDLGKEVKALSEAGYKRIWVTPKIPFIVPMTASIILSAVIGNWLLCLFPF